MGRASSRELMTSFRYRADVLMKETFFSKSQFFSSNPEMSQTCPVFELDRSDVVCAQEDLLAPSDGVWSSCRSQGCPLTTGTGKARLCTGIPIQSTICTGILVVVNPCI